MVTHVICACILFAACIPVFYIYMLCHLRYNLGEWFSESETHGRYLTSDVAQHMMTLADSWLNVHVVSHFPRIRNLMSLLLLGNQG